MSVDTNHTTRGKIEGVPQFMVNILRLRKQGFANLPACVSYSDIKIHYYLLIGLADLRFLGKVSARGPESS